MAIRGVIEGRRGELPIYCGHGLYADIRGRQLQIAPTDIDQWLFRARLSPRYAPNGAP